MPALWEFSTLAQVEAPAKQPAQPGGPIGDICGGIGVPMLAVAVLFYFILLRPQHRDEKRRRQQLAAIKKNDHVVTVGGIIGIVTNVRDDELTIRVDDDTNTKLRITRSSVSRILDLDAKEKGT